MPTLSTVQKILLGTYLFSVVISMAVCSAKYRALGFHTRDYPLYIEFASKFFDNGRMQAVSINSEGENWLYMNGAEGVKDIEQSIHFEPIKYLYAALYKVFASPYVLFLFASLIVFFPILYLALMVGSNPKLDAAAALTISVLYLAFPSALFVPSYDLRPYMFLPPFFLLSILSIQFARPFWEQLFWFNFMFLAREEALILGVVVILYGAVNQSLRNMHKANLVGLCASYLFWLIAIVAYFRWANYPIATEKLPEYALNVYQRFVDFDLKLLLILLVAAGFGLVIAWFIWKRFQSHPFFQGFVDILAIGSLLVPLIFQLIRDHKPGDLEIYFFSPKYFLHYTALIILMIVVQHHIKVKIGQTLWAGMLAGLICIAALTHIIAPNGLVKTFSRLTDRAHSTEIVWQFTQDLNPATKVLTDYETHQAFYEFDNSFAYNRLPWHLVSGNRRYYPANHPFIQALLKDEINFIVISRTSENDIYPLLEKAELKIEALFENEQFIVIEIVKGQ